MELTPQQQAFLVNYLDPNSDTWSNAMQSALKAGYSREYSESITAQMPKWLSEYLGDSILVKKALENLESLLDDEDTRVRADMTKFTLERLNKNKFSTRQELTGKDGKDLMVKQEEKEMIDKAFSNL